MNAPNTGIPYVPEGTLDPAAGLNLALDVADALIQTQVISMALTAPPGGEQDGDLYIPAAPATGVWALHENDLARFVADGAFWQFFTAGAQVRLVLNLDDGALYAFDGASSPGVWAPVTGGGGGAVASVVAGPGISVDATDPANPIVSAAAGGAPLFDQSEAAVPSATETDYDPGTWAGGATQTRLVLTPAADCVLNSLDASGMADGKSVLIVNDSSAFTITLTHEHGGSTADNRFQNAAAVDFAVLPYQAIILTRCSSRWRPL